MDHRAFCECKYTHIFSITKIFDVGKHVFKFFFAKFRFVDKTDKATRGLLIDVYDDCLWCLSIKSGDWQTGTGYSANALLRPLNFYVILLSE